MAPRPGSQAACPAAPGAPRPWGHGPVISSSLPAEGRAALPPSPGPPVSRVPAPSPPLREPSCGKTNAGAPRRCRVFRFRPAADRVLGIAAKPVVIFLLVTGRAFNLLKKERERKTSVKCSQPGAIERGLPAGLRWADRRFFAGWARCGDTSTAWPSPPTPADARCWRRAGIVRAPDGPWPRLQDAWTPSGGPEPPVALLPQSPPGDSGDWMSQFFSSMSTHRPEE